MVDVPQELEGRYMSASTLNADPPQVIKMNEKATNWNDEGYVECPKCSARTCWVGGQWWCLVWCGVIE